MNLERHQENLSEPYLHEKRHLTPIHVVVGVVGQINSI